MRTHQRQAVGFPALHHLAAVLLILNACSQAWCDLPGAARITCPNHDPFAEQSCTNSPFAPDGGGQRPTFEPVEQPPVGVADPVSVAHGYVVKSITDVSIPVMYGLRLEVTRRYSSTDLGITTANDNGDSMFGPGWYCTYESCLEDAGSFLDGLYFAYHDEWANVHHISESGSEYRSLLMQGAPMVLEQLGTYPSYTYTLRGPGYEERGFDEDGRLTYIEANYHTEAEERLTFQYDGNDHLYRVNAPAADGRYLTFHYDDTNWPDRVTKVSLTAGMNTYDLIQYYADGSGRLSVVRHNPTYYSSSNDNLIYYEYGSYDPTGSPAWTAGNKLGRISYYLNQEGTGRNIVAYKYGTSTVSKIFTWDVAATTPAWVNTVSLDSNPNNHLPTVYFGEGDATDPQANYVLSYSNDIASINYSYLPSDVKMPPAHYFDSQGNSCYACGNGVPRVIESARLQDENNAWYYLWEKDYDLSNSDFLLRYRILTDTKYATSVTPLATTYTYDDDFGLSAETVTNPLSELLVTNAYGKSPGGDYGRLVSSEKHGLTTSYTYNGDGLLDSMEDHEGNITAYDYDARGNLDEITMPDGNVVTRTFNDFGQMLTETRTHLGTTTYVYSNATYLSDGVTTVPSIEKYLPPRLIEARNANGDSTRYFYTADNRPWKTTDAHGVTTENTYDRRGRLVSVENGEGEVTEYEYDVYDRMITFIDGRGKETKYEYDVFGRLVKETDPDSHYKEYAYSDGTNPGGCGCGGSGSNVIRRIRQEDGKYIHFHHDVAGRLKKLWYSANATITPSSYEEANPQLTYSYDDASRVTSITDTRLTTSGNAYAFTYDAGDTGRLEKVTHPEGYTQEYIYQDNDQEDHYRRLVGYRDVDGHVVKYNYDALERISTITDGYGDDTTYTYATTSDTAYPVGAMMRSVYGNNAKNDFTYDNLGRLGKVEYLNGSNSVFDYFDLAYNAAGMITEKKRKDGGSYFTTKYDYDDAYRLISEETFNGSNVEKTARVYGYDAAGNRTSMAFGNDSLSTKTTTYSYGNREQIVSNTGYYREGTTDTGNMAYTWDAKGNMLTRTGQTLEWNEDNRLTKVWVSGGDPKAELFQKIFKYDYAGRRILEYKNTDGVRTRSFFNGLTEEIKKVSVGTGADTSFARTVKIDSDETDWVNWGSRSWHEWDGDRMSDVTKTVNEESNGKTWWESGDGWNITGKRTFSVWAKSSSHGAHVTICVKATDGSRYGLIYQGSTTTPYNSGSAGFLTIQGTAGDFTNGEWVRLERDLQADLTSRFGKTLSCVTGIYLWSGGTSSPYLYIDDVSFSNSLTIEHNTLSPASIGQIVRHIRINPSSYAQSNFWFHYDQVGSVVAESDINGTLLETHQQDAFGNTQASWSSGLWGGNRPGWHHNTIEFGLVQFGV